MGENTHDHSSGEGRDLTPRRALEEPAPGPGEGADALARLLPLAGPRPPIPPERAARVEAMVRARWARQVRARRWRRVGLASAAALVTLALGIAIWWQVGAPPPADREPMARIERVAGTVLRDDGSAGSRPLVAGEWLEPGVTLDSGDGRAALRLGAEASLRLDRSTRVRLIERGRLELIAGGLYIDSQGGQEDIRVETRWGEVRKLGTQFEVRAAGDGVRLRVREGSVVLRSGDDAHEVGSGVELALTAGGQGRRRAIAPHAREWDWVASIAPSFELDGSTLGELLDWVSRETGREVRFADPELATTARALVLGGAVEELSPEQALLAVLPTCGLEHRLEDEAYVLVRGRS